MTYQTLTTHTADGVMVLTLNRPDRLNAFTLVMMQEMIAALDVADADDDVRAIIVTGAGRGFCAGVDLDDPDAFTSARPDMTSTDPAVWNDPTNRDMGGLVALRLFNCLKPVIAAVNGPAVGIGMTMQLPMDIRIASTSARFGFVFARRGIVPEAASSWFLPRLVGMSQALEWCYSGRVFGADEALAGGLVRSVHDPEDLLAEAHRIARDIADNTAPVSIALTRQMMWRMAGAAHPMAAHQIDSRGIAARSGSADAAEGVASFMEKRAPVFRDKVSTDMPGFFPWWDEPEWTMAPRKGEPK
ncbi:crotonase/enoyl-CoA hydratase family protein [Pseudosulfitobacter pseudonitzschiae]|uniref:crotonase/enoyl-CoA hydratase family protein n=1 Tax=Pseudosulfitobacter pseudonitzschiae TaxID=1402135 RepID=UPI001AF862F6|nr:crotonase/enoyl-CoA hydratase family protein [Pseudosulfitobacter pseudonitzschiae]MBM1816807.1 crotonase/enoyl-CoA hydratase family protein [Pseudosulfitobacter pseudonitzschiae]MBM1833618.1 crotonase/enoyl-CoA hydratase family protein [Pseudosulfitobacter pseudonitzschiae]MBM1838484.1 crotonase/enoyl-CoA hydratase family protein [Pseudosulfitobacter pseudonitzschiae]MBM1843535.1 crotonase/enoyl-CoA hydratase family protein [Pseudosulfitobacter pseudonitzschiae]MBM1848400.1 crotonase/enoyl